MSDARQRLLERRKRLEEQLAELDRREALQKRRDDRKRAELAGTAVLAHAKTDPHFAAIFRSILDGSVLSKRDRALFGLGEAQSAPAPNQNRPEIRLELRQRGEVA